MTTRLCHYEGEVFPSDQFRLDPARGWVHDVVPLHTVDGDIVFAGASNDPGFDHALPEAPSE